MRRLGFALGGLLVATVLFIGTPATASTVTYQFTIDHCGGGCGVPAGEVILEDIALGDVKVTVDLANANLFVNTGLPATFLWNLIGNPTISVTGVVAPWALISTTAGNLSFDGFKEFDYGLVLNTAQGLGGAVAGPLVFHVLAGGLTTASFSEQSHNTPPGNGGTAVYFGADIWSSTTGFTGPVGATGSCIDCTPIPHLTDTPEPTSLVLLGSGLIAATRGLRRFKR